MENPHLISMSAVRSAMKVVYTPGLTLKSPIGLRNDPHTATILHYGNQYRVDFEGAVSKMPPFDRRDFDAWYQSEAGQAFQKWSDRAFAMAAALELIQKAWTQETEEEEEKTDPFLQKLADVNWWFETHGVWFVIVAFIIAFVTFFGTGPMEGGVATVIRVVAGILIAILLLIWAGSKALPSFLRSQAKKRGVAVPTHEQLEVEPQAIWTEESEVTSAKILNYVNWAMLAQPGSAGLMKLDPPDPVEPTPAHTERQVKILEAAKRWRDDSPLRPRKSLS